MKAKFSIIKFLNYFTIETKQYKDREIITNNAQSKCWIFIVSLKMHINFEKRKTIHIWYQIDLL